MALLAWCHLGQIGLACGRIVCVQLMLLQAAVGFVHAQLSSVDIEKLSLFFAGLYCGSKSASE